MTTNSLSRRSFVSLAAGAGATGLVLAVTPEALQARPMSKATKDVGEGFAPNVYVQIEPGGDVNLILHRSEMGQGARTSCAMMLAEELDVDWSAIKLVQATGDKKYGDQNTDGSTTVRINWQPLREAGAKARALLVAAAASEWGVDAKECTTDNGMVVHQGSGKKAGYGSLALGGGQAPCP